MHPPASRPTLHSTLRPTLRPTSYWPAPVGRSGAALVAVLVALAGCGGGEPVDTARPAGAAVPSAPARVTDLAAPAPDPARRSQPPARTATGLAALAATREGDRLLTVDRTAARIRLLQRADGRVLREWSWPAEPGGEARLAGLAVSADASLLLLARRDSTVVAYALEPAGARQVWRGHAQPVRTVALSADGRRAASAGDDTRVLWWDTTQARLLGVVAAGAGVVDALALSADGAWLATAGADGRVRVWDLSRDRLVAQLDPQSGPVRALAFGAGTAWLASAGADGSVTLWDLASRSAVRRLSSPAPVAALGFADAAAGVLVAGTEDGRLLTWALAAGAAR